jgi:SAM-dependent methyltransferase
MNIDNNGILIGEKSETIGTEFHKTRGKSALLRELKNDPMHQINWETPYYNRFIDECLEGIDLTDKVCLDLGSGDGRFTDYLIKKGVKKVISLDSDYQPLYNLSKHSEEEGYRDKIELIHSGAENIPIENESVDVVLALGVYYYLGEKQVDGLKETYSKMKKGGILISSEPNLEGIALRSLLFNTLGDMLDNFNKHNFKEEQNDTKYRFPLYEEKKLLSLYNLSGFELDYKKGLSIFHQIIRIQYVRGLISKEELESNLENLKGVFDYLDENGKMDKTIMYKHIKR